MDGTDKNLLDLIKGNARMSYQEMSRVAAKKRVDKLEKTASFEAVLNYHQRKPMILDILLLNYDKIYAYSEWDVLN